MLKGRLVSTEGGSYSSSKYLRLCALDKLLVWPLTKESWFDERDEFEACNFLSLSSSTFSLRFVESFVDKDAVDDDDEKLSEYKLVLLLVKLELELELLLLRLELRLRLDDFLLDELIFKFKKNYKWTVHSKISAHFYLWMSNFFTRNSKII